MEVACYEMAIYHEKIYDEKLSIKDLGSYTAWMTAREGIKLIIKDIEKDG